MAQRAFVLNLRIKNLILRVFRQISLIYVVLVCAIAAEADDMSSSLNKHMKKAEFQKVLDQIKDIKSCLLYTSDAADD